MIRMLALDVDGTLAVRGDEVSSATRAALHRAASANVEIVIATGRRFRTARRVVEAVGLPTPVVCLGGALIKSGAFATLNACCFEPDLTHRIGNILFGFFTKRESLLVTARFGVNRGQAGPDGEL